MQRVKRSTAVAVLPAPPAGGVPGFFAAPNPQGGVPATVPGYEWYNMMQEEVLSVIEGQALVPSDADHTQLRQAITKMIQAGQRAVIIDSAVFAPAVAGTGKAVYWDQANTRFDLALADGTARQSMVGFADVANSKVYAFGDAVLFAGLTPGGRYYLDGTTAGAITVTAPTNAVFVGIARSATEMFVDIDELPQSNSASIQGAFKNLQASATGLGALITITADEIIVERASNAYETLRNVNVTINSAAVGANGLDTGVLAASTWYAKFIIWNGTTKAALLSLSATAPTLPAGYTGFARTGWIRTDGTANKYPLSFLQKDDSVLFKVAAGSNVPASRQITSGAIGDINLPNYVAVAWGNFAPSTAKKIIVMMKVNNATMICSPSASYGGLLSTSNPPFAVLSNVNPDGRVVVITPESSNIYMAGQSGETYILGWEDSL